MRKSRGADLAYLTTLPPDQARARRMIHDAVESEVAIARDVGASRHEEHRSIYAPPRPTMPRPRTRKASCLRIQRGRLIGIAGAERADGADLLARLGGGPDRREIFDTLPIALTIEDTARALRLCAAFPG
jgi:hypothetical protein